MIISLFLRFLRILALEIAIGMKGEDSFKEQTCQLDHGQATPEAI